MSQVTEAVADFQIRHGTQDQEVFDEVYVENIYRLPDRLPSDSIVVDIGANIGAFAVACLQRGAGTVICFEPSEENFKQLSQNLSPWPGAAAFLAGVWRSDVEQAVAFAPGGGSAAGCCFPSSIDNGQPVPCRVNTIGLDQLLIECTDDGFHSVSLLKIDAEFSEYPILFSSARLDLVDEIIGEIHEFTDNLSLSDRYYSHPAYRNTTADVVRFLRDSGFVVTTEKHQNNTLFFGKRKTPENV